MTEILSHNTTSPASSPAKHSSTTESTQAYSPLNEAEYVLSDENRKQHAQLRRVLGTPALVFFGLAYLVPTTIFSSYGLVVSISKGHLAMAYVITGIAVVFTAISYARLSKIIPSAGSAYAYATRAFGNKIGFLTGWVVLLDYLLLPMVNYVLAGIFVSAQFPSIPAWTVSLSAIVIVTVMNIIGIGVVRMANILMASAQLLFIVLFLAFALYQPDPKAGLFDSFYTPGMSWSGVFMGASILALSFLGFDAISTMSEEAKDPRRAVPRAIIITTVVATVVFIVVAWAAHIAYPHWQTFTNTDTASTELMGHLGGAFLKAVFLVTLLVGCVASALASQASVSRILYSMGRDGTLPRKIFGSLHPRFLTPVRAILITSAIGCLGLVLPFAQVASMISFGALAAFSLVNLSVIGIFWVKRKQRGVGAFFTYIVLPLIGFGMTAWLWTSLEPLALIVGCIWTVVGILWLFFGLKGAKDLNPDGFFDDDISDDIKEKVKPYM